MWQKQTQTSKISYFPLCDVYRRSIILWKNLFASKDKRVSSLINAHVSPVLFNRSRGAAYCYEIQSRDLYWEIRCVVGILKSRARLCFLGKQSRSSAIALTITRLTKQTWNNANTYNRSYISFKTKCHEFEGKSQQAKSECLISEVLIEKSHWLSNKRRILKACLLATHVPY